MTLWRVDGRTHMDLQLNGTRVLITGSSQGIGFAIAAACAAEGAHVIINGRSQASVDAAVQRLGGSAEGVVADLSGAAGVQHLIEAAGRVDVLINNAGGFDVSDFWNVGDQEWNDYLELHLLAAMRLSRALLPGMLERGWGRIITVASEAGVNVPGDMLPYGVAKGAVLALGNGLAKLTKGTEVTVNTVLGGPTYSEGVQRAVEGIAAAQGMMAEDLRKALVRDSSLLQRFLEPHEIAAPVTFLASPLSVASNGAAIRLDGGVLQTLL